MLVNGSFPVVVVVSFMATLNGPHVWSIKLRQARARSKWAIKLAFVYVIKSLSGGSSARLEPSWRRRSRNFPINYVAVNLLPISHKEGGGRVAIRKQIITPIPVSRSSDGSRPSPEVTKCRQPSQHESTLSFLQWVLWLYHFNKNLREWASIKFLWQQ